MLLHCLPYKKKTTSRYNQYTYVVEKDENKKNYVTYFSKRTDRPTVD